MRIVILDERKVLRVKNVKGWEIGSGDGKEKSVHIIHYIFCCSNLDPEEFCLCQFTFTVKFLQTHSLDRMRTTHLVRTQYLSDTNGSNVFTERRVSSPRAPGPSQNARDSLDTDTCNKHVTF